MRALLHSLRRDGPLRRWPLFIALAGLLEWSALVAFHGGSSLGRFERMDQHRFTAMALVRGLLRIRGSMLHVQHDDQVWNGAGYTNWSYGVPLLQVPFHALLGRLGSLHGFFPDRAIYFVYFAALVPILWAAFDRAFARWLAGAPPLRRHALSFAATWATLASALYPLMRSRFLIYEETLGYFEVFELLALAAFVFFRDSGSLASVVGLAVAAGFGLLIRPTGLVYLAAWFALVALARRPKTVLALALTSLPFVAFWLTTNLARTGSPLALGYANTNPAYDFQMPIHRFGSVCDDSASHVLAVATRLFAAFFVYVSPHGDAWLDACNFTFERRSANHEPFFDPVVPIALGWMLVQSFRTARSREARAGLGVPYAAMALLFVLFVQRGQEFAWRYTADFWPLIVLAAVAWTLSAERPLRPRGDVPITAVLLGWGTLSFLRFVEPWDPSASPPEVLTEPAVASIADDFRASLEDRDAPLPARMACGDPLIPFYKNGQGWKDGCRVDTSTNVYLGVPPKNDDHYRLRFQAEDAPSAALRVYVNGRIYTARGERGLYETDVRIPFSKLTSPIVLSTIEWTRALEAPATRLLWIELD
jgi:hypothetical protein